MKSSTSGSDEMREFLLWARRQRFALSRVKLGELEVDIAADLELAPSAPSLATPAPSEDPYETFGGTVLAKLRALQERESKGDSVVDEDD